MEYDSRIIYNKIINILGDEFEYTWIHDKSELTNNKLFQFKFINKSKMLNKDKSKFIKNKIELLKKNNFIEIKNLKISGIGRFIIIMIKTPEEYENEKKEIEEEFKKKIIEIDNKINMVKNINYG